MYTVLQNSRPMGYSRRDLTAMTHSRPGLGKTLKFTTKTRDRQATNLDEFVTRAVSVVRHLARVLSQQTRNSDGATRLNRKITQLWLSRSFKVIQPHRSAVWRSPLRFSRTPSCLLHFIPAYQHLIILHSPCSVSQTI